MMVDTRWNLESTNLRWSRVFRGINRVTRHSPVEQRCSQIRRPFLPIVALFPCYPFLVIARFIVVVFFSVFIASEQYLTSQLLLDFIACLCLFNTWRGRQWLCKPRDSRCNDIQREKSRKLILLCGNVCYLSISNYYVCYLKGS
jgi:hypothetical protein